MLYGHFSKYDDEISTFIIAATTYKELQEFQKQFTGKDKLSIKYDDMVIPDPIMDYMLNKDFSHYNTSVQFPIFIHSSDREQQEFVNECNITILNKVKALDKHSDMLSVKEMEDEIKEMEKYPQLENLTIAEIYGLKENDKFDRRTDKEKEQDRQKDEYNKMIKSQLKYEVDAENMMTIENVSLSNNNGKINLDGVSVKKNSSEVNEELKKYKEMLDKASDDYVPTAEDFAAAWFGSKNTAIGESVDIRGMSSNSISEEELSNKFSDNAKKIREKYTKIKDEYNAKETEIVIKEMEKMDIQNKLNGIFQGADLGGITKINVVDLPLRFSKILTEYEKYTDTEISLALYPFASEINDTIIIPTVRSIDPDKQIVVIYTEKLKHLGGISIGDTNSFANTHLYKREYENDSGWVLMKYSDQYIVIKIKEFDPSVLDGNEED